MQCLVLQLQEVQQKGLGVLWMAAAALGTLALLLALTLKRAVAQVPAQRMTSVSVSTASYRGRRPVLHRPATKRSLQACESSHIYDSHNAK